VEIYFFDFGIGSHHDGGAPERNREHSIRDQLSALNVGFMERLHSNAVDVSLGLLREPQVICRSLEIPAVMADAFALRASNAVAAFS
ncbi:hypothetical protein L9Z73_01495, partial [Pseudomonas sp. TNT11]